MATGGEDIFVDEEMEPDPELNHERHFGCSDRGAPDARPRVSRIGLCQCACDGVHAAWDSVSAVWIDVVHKGEVVGRARMDFLVEDKVIVELKAVEEMIPLYGSQAVSYLRATHEQLALLLNFNVRRLKDGIRRVAN